MRRDALRLVPGLTLSAAVFLALGCGGESPPDSPSPSSPPPPSSNEAEGRAVDPAGPAASIVLEDITAASGIDFRHDASESAERSYPEIIGAGAAVLDFDGDGDLDVYLVQGGRIPGVDAGTERANRLLRNDGRGVFTDVTEAAGDAGHRGFGMGAYAVDVDGDGRTDLHLTNVGPDALLRNDGDGRFTDVTATAGLAGGAFGYGLGAAWFDMDGDGHLDVYVAEYVHWRPGIDPECMTGRGTRDYCGPANYAGAPDRLYRNRGDGTFEDVSQSAGIAGLATRSMGVVAADFDGDGLEDVFVANDGEPNLLWRNLGDGTFVEEAALWGCAVNADGLAEASMGVAVGDPDGDGDFDLLLTHLVGETHTFYRNEGGWFTDATAEVGIDRWSRPDTGFGVAWTDLDHDGEDDLVIVNGAVMLPMQPKDPDLPYAEPDRVVRSVDGRWTDTIAVPAPGGRPRMGRGVIAADLDGDGGVELLLTNNRGPAQLLRARVERPGRWVGLMLADEGPNRDALGATVAVMAADGTPGDRRWLVRPHRGFLTSSDPVVRIGLGQRAEDAVGVLVRWPDGTRETFAGLRLDRVHRLERGRGSTASGGPATLPLETP